jgi:hypothetical protein
MRFHRSKEAFWAKLVGIRDEGQAKVAVSVGGGTTAASKVADCAPSYFRLGAATAQSRTRHHIQQNRHFSQYRIRYLSRWRSDLHRETRHHAR